MTELRMFVCRHTYWLVAFVPLLIGESRQGQVLQELETRRGNTRWFSMWSRGARQSSKYVTTSGRGLLSKEM